MYRIKAGNFVRIDEKTKKEFIIGPKIMIAWSYETDPTYIDRIRGTLHKIGRPQFVEQWIEATQEKIIASGHPDLMGILGTLTFEVNTIPIEEINRMVDITGYVGRWLEKKGLIEEIQKEMKRREAEDSIASKEESSWPEE